MSADYGPPEMMAVAMARLIQANQIVFVGVNSPLPLVAAALARQLHDSRLTVITIAGGINPSLSRLYQATTNPALAIGSASIFDNPDLYDLVARDGLDVTFLGAAQVDKFGNLNSSMIGGPDRPRVRFPGGGGAAYILPLARRTIVWRAAHSAKIFVARCEFVTAAGNVDRIVTPLCVFRKVAGRLMLESRHPYVTAEELQGNTGFEIEAANGAIVTPPPTTHELTALRRVDPDGVRASEFDDTARPASAAGASGAAPSHGHSERII